MANNTSSVPPALVATYFVVFVALAGGTWLFMRKLDAPDKKRLYARVVLLNSTVIGGFMIAMMLAGGAGCTAFVIIPIGAGFFYLNATRNRLCMQCNRNVAPSGLAACEFCPRCGAQTTPYDGLLGEAEP